MTEFQKFYAAELASATLKNLRGEAIIKKGEYPNQEIFDAGLKVLCERRREPKPDINSDVWLMAYEAIQEMIALESSFL